MNVSKEFSRFADHYGEYNVIQEKVADRLFASIHDRPLMILDIGCGRGAFAKRIDWPYDRLVGIDFSSKMLELHPENESIECIYGDFDDPELYADLKRYAFERIVSVSALQWSSDLAATFAMIASLDAPVSLAVFANGTFKTLFETAGLSPLLQDASKIAAMAEDQFGATCETINYSLSFDNPREMLRYIKRSGVSGNRNVLSYTALKQLMRTYPTDTLEFEVVFISS